MRTSVAVASPAESRPRFAVGELGLVLALAVSASVWAAALFALARDRYLNFELGRYDLGNMAQAVWSTAQGRPLEETNGFTGEQMSRLGSHVDPILAALAPLWLVAPSPQTLIVVQIVAVALGTIPIYLLGRRHLGERAGALLALAYLAYPWLAWTALDAFHPVTLAIPLFLFAFWALDSDRLVVFAVCASLAALTGELMALPIVVLGLWYALARGQRFRGIAISAAALAWVLFAVYVVVPHYSGGESAFYGVYGQIGSSPTGVLHTAVTDPLRVASAASRPGDWLYLLLVAAPLGGLFVLAPGVAAAALPQVAANVLSDVRWTTDPHSHYVAAVVPFLFVAICLGLSRFPEQGRVRGALLVLTLSLAAGIMAGPWPGAAGTPSWYRAEPSPARLAALREAVALVPRDAPVTSTTAVGGHLAARRYAYVVPVVRRAEWIVVDTSDSWRPLAYGGVTDPAGLRDFLVRVERDRTWKPVFEREGVLVFRKGYP